MDDNPNAPPRPSYLRHAIWWMLGCAIVVGMYGSTLLGDKNPMGFLFVLASPFVGLVLCVICNAIVGREIDKFSDRGPSADGITWLPAEDADTPRERH